MLVSCVVCVWLGCISVVPTTVRESATPDSKEKNQADARTRLFSKVFPAARCREIVLQQSVKVYLHMYNGNVQQYPLCAEPCVRNCSSGGERESIFYTTCSCEKQFMTDGCHLCSSSCDGIKYLIYTKVVPSVQQYIRLPTRCRVQQ